MIQISVVVPVRNEEENVFPLIEEISAALKGMEHEILFVNDGSTDETQARLKKAQKDYPSLRVLRHKIACGQSTAVHTGILHARAPYIATLDGDGQNDPADIPRMFEHLLASSQGGDRQVQCVCGFRRRRRDSGIKRISSLLANGIRRRLLKDETPDTGCGLKVFSREAFLRLPYFDHMHRFLPALFIRYGARVVSFEVNHRHRTQGKSKYGFFDRLWAGLFDLAGVFWLQKRSRLPEIFEEKE